MGESRSVGFTFYAKDLFDPVARKVAASMDRIRNSVDNVGQAADRSNKAGARFRGDWTTFATNAKRLAATYLSAQTVRHVLAETASAETALLKVMSAIRDPADQLAYQSKIESIIKANRALGYSLDDVSESLSLQVQNMGATDKAFAAFAAGSKLATAAFQPLGPSVDAINALIEAYPKLAAQPERAAQLLFTTRQLSKDYGGLIQSLPQVTQLSARAGLSPERQMALFSVLANEAKSPGQAGSAMFELIRTLSVKGSPKQDALLRRLKIDATPAGLAEAGLEKQLQRLSLVARNRPDLMSHLGISDTAQKVLLTLDQADIEKIGKLEAAIREDMGKDTLGTAFERVQQSLSKDFAALSASMESLAGVIGKELAPSVRTIANKLTTASNVIEGTPAIRGGIHGFFGPARGRRSVESSILGDLISAPIDAVIGALEAQRGAGGLDPGARPKE